MNILQAIKNWTVNILQAIKNWMVRRPGNEAFTYTLPIASVLYICTEFRSGLEIKDVN